MAAVRGSLCIQVTLTPEPIGEGDGITQAALSLLLICTLVATQRQGRTPGLFLPLVLLLTEVYSFVL